HQAPPHQAKMPPAILQDHYGYRLCWRNVKPLREIWLFEIAKYLPQGVGRRRDHKTSTHCDVQIGMRSAPFNPNPPTLRPRTAAAAKPARHEPGLDDEVRIARLRAANINPRTGLATDYLNHFNEAIMLLEMIPDMPECAEDFLSWRPLSY